VFVVGVLFSLPGGLKKLVDFFPFRVGPPANVIEVTTSSPSVSPFTTSKLISSVTPTVIFCGWSVP
jgi:hypothetical protein